jgi:hypothetical protein
MKYTNLAVSISEQPFSLHGFCFPDIISPSLHKGKMAQTHYFFPASKQSAISLQVDLKGAEGYCKPDVEEAKNKWSIDYNKFPYGQSESQWWEYCVAPHSYLPLNDGKIQVGLNFFNRFLHLDFNLRSAQLVDPGVGNAMLSTTNWFDQKTGELWFASWPASQTVRRILNPRENVHITIWKFSVQNNHVKQVWQGDLGDSLHQLSLSPDRRFLILTELGLRPEEAIPAESPEQAPSAWRRVRERGLVPSKILVLNLKTGEEWRLPVMTAGHVEFDPEDEEVCYLSGHNIGLIGAKVGIFGPGTIKKIRLKKTGPELAGEFSHPHFYRITTHIVFRHRGKIMIGVSGYPSTVFLIDAATMKLYKTIAMDPVDIVETSQTPHICQQDSYGIAASEDGETILAAGTGFVQAALIDEGRFSFNKGIDGYDANSCFTGHLGIFNISPKGINHAA